MTISKQKKIIINDVISANSGVFIISAAAGTGKTTLLRGLINLLLESSPDTKIRFMSSVNKTIDYGQKVIGSEQAVIYDNFHKLGLRVIREHLNVPIRLKDIRLAGYQQDLIFSSPPGKIFDQKGSEDRLKSLAVDHGLGARGLGKVAADHLKQCFAVGSWTSHSETIDRLIRLYCDHKTLVGAVDYNDMIVLANGLLKHKSVRLIERNSHDYLALDECQDLSVHHFRMASYLKGKRTKLVMVGDPCQTAYGFNGAKGDIFERVKERYGPEVEEYFLNKSRRCSGPICELSNAVTKRISYANKTEIQALKSGEDDPLPQLYFHRGETDGVLYVVNQMKRLHASEGIPYGDMVVLFRQFPGKEHAVRLKALREHLQASGIHYTVKKDLKKKVEVGGLFLSALKIALDSGDQGDLVSVLNLVKGMSAVQIDLVGDDLILMKDRRVKRLIEDLQIHGPEAPLRVVVNHVADVLERKKVKVGGLRNLFGAFKNLKRLDLNWEDQVNRGHDATDSVVISSIHGFKGDEKQCVFLVGVECSSFKRDGSDPDEIRCILNIAITRSKRWLFMTCRQQGMRRREESISQHLIDAFKGQSVSTLPGHP